jgi:hypothetical protein
MHRNNMQALARTFCSHSHTTMHMYLANAPCLQLRAAAKQALLRHKFLEARHILDEAVSLHPDSYKVGHTQAAAF